MPQIRESAYLLAAAVLITLVMAGCASVRPANLPDLRPTEDRVEGARNGWWNVRFLVKWPQDAEPSWHVDLLLAHKIISPVLYQYKDSIILWRFHRRAIRDQLGHQFSFIFYSSAETANRIYDLIKSDACLKEMKNAGVIIEDRYDATDWISKANIEDTCDPKWSSPIKKSWPYFIMGVSQMWLNLITDISDQQTSSGKRPQFLRGIQAFYGEVDESVEKLWQKEGGHAFLHHLNAMFGYEGVIIYEKRLMTF